MAAVRLRAKLSRVNTWSTSGLRDIFVRALGPVVRLTQEAFVAERMQVCQIYLITATLSPAKCRPVFLFSHGC